MSDTASQDNDLAFDDPGGRGRIRLQAFQDPDAIEIAAWVQTKDQLKQLAPGTPGPLTPEKVSGWRRAKGHAFALWRDGLHAPIGYAELNPMSRDRGHFWLGHVIVSPAERGNGLGTAFVRALARYAFERCHAGRISLIVLPNNIPALACYRRVGFVPIRDEFHDFGAAGKSMRMLRLELTASDWTSQGTAHH